VTLIHDVVNDRQRKSYETVHCMANGRNVDINTRVPYLPFDMPSVNEFYIFNLVFSLSLMDFNNR
jgi:hypothetical protein